MTEATTEQLSHQQQDDASTVATTATAATTVTNSTTTTTTNNAGESSPSSSVSSLRSILDAIDAVVETYLVKIVQPFLKRHEVFYGELNWFLRRMLDDNDVPEWFTANFITYARTWLVFPTLFLLSREHQLLVSILIVLVDVGDFLDGVVARYWNDQRKAKEDENKDKKPVDPDDEKFVVDKTATAAVVPSWTKLHHDRTYGGFVDAVCDKAYVVPCWIALLHVVPMTMLLLRWYQYAVFFCLILAEVASGCVRFRAYYSNPAVAAPKVVGLDVSTSAVKADHVGKAKQTFEMIGTALYVVHYTRYLGLALLSLAVPLAYESVRRKIKPRTFYVAYPQQPKGGRYAPFDHKTARFWMQVKSMGSKLIVGVPAPSASSSSSSGGDGGSTDAVLNACSSQCVDDVVCNAPVVDADFIEANGIDYVVLQPQQQQASLVADDLIRSNRVLILGSDNVARAVQPKEQDKKD